jgi:hypothetical protein
MEIVQGRCKLQSVAIDYTHVVPLKALSTMAQCPRDSVSARSHDYDVTYGVPCPLKITHEVTSIVQGRSKLQDHYHELRASSLAQSV